MIGLTPALNLICTGTEWSGKYDPLPGCQLPAPLARYSDPMQTPSECGNDCKQTLSIHEVEVNRITFQYEDDKEGRDTANSSAENLILRIAYDFCRPLLFMRALASECHSQNFQPEISGGRSRP